MSAGFFGPLTSGRFIHLRTPDYAILRLSRVTNYAFSHRRLAGVGSEHLNSSNAEIVTLDKRAFLRVVGGS